MKRYKYVKAPPEYPGTCYSWGNRVLEHHLVWWKNTGHVVWGDEVVHHKNRDTRDNAFDNLQLTTRGAHTSFHHPCKRLLMSCAFCKKSFYLREKVFKWKKSHGQRLFFCCKLHSALAWGRTHQKESPIRHGKLVTYDYHKCRCSKCRKAKARAAQKYRRKLKTGSWSNGTTSLLQGENSGSIPEGSTKDF